ncbi:hypothetical protein ACLMJK_001209 [Lecanora helva]
MLLFRPLSISPLLPLAGLVASASQSTTSSTPNLRIEGPDSTIFEGPITSGPRNLTAIVSDAGYNEPCDGLNGGANAKPFNTALDAFDAASKPPNPGFAYTLGYDGDLNDFYVLSVAGYSTNSWGLFYNWKIPYLGERFVGCRQEVQTGDNVLWAFNASDTTVLLKVSPDTVTVKKGGSVTFTIIDGLTGKLQPSATIHSVQANSKGQVVVNYPTTGYFPFKAKETGAIRSEIVKVTVTN